MKGEKKRKWATCDYFRTVRQMGFERLDESRIDNRSSIVMVLEVYLVYLPSRNC